MRPRRVPNVGGGSDQPARPTGPALDRDVRMTWADGSEMVHKTRSSSPTVSLRLAIDEAARWGWDVVRVEIVG